MRNRAIFLSLLTLAAAWSQNARADSQSCVESNNQGADLRGAHQLLAARAAYQACAADPACPGIVRSECDAAMSDLRQSIPSLLIAVVDRLGQDVPEATLQVDGHPVAHDGSPIDVDPGTHLIFAQRGAQQISLQIVALENEPNRHLELRLPSAVPAETREPVGAAEQPPSTPPAMIARPSRVPAYVLAGVSAAGLASFSYFAISGHSRRDGLYDCKPSCAPDDVRDVRNRYLFADISLGISAVALGTAAFLFFRASDHAPAARAGLSFDLGITREAAALQLKWRN